MLSESFKRIISKMNISHGRSLVCSERGSWILQEKRRKNEKYENSERPGPKTEVMVSINTFQVVWAEL